MKKLIVTACFAIATSCISFAQFHLCKILRRMDILGRLMVSQKKFAFNINNPIFPVHFYSINPMDNNSVQKGIYIDVK